MIHFMLYIFYYNEKGSLEKIKDVIIMYDIWLAINVMVSSIPGRVFGGIDRIHK